jgi:hypothetical protein
MGGDRGHPVAERRRIIIREGRALC